VGFFYLSAFESGAFNAAKQDGLAALIQESYEGRTQSLQSLRACGFFFACLLLKAGLSARPNKKNPFPLHGKGFVPRTGFEPAHPFEYHHLKVACLPISTPGLLLQGVQI
jgi:hypothetical protein